jgi:hypothetical protein
MDVLLRWLDRFDLPRDLCKSDIVIIFEFVVLIKPFSY